MKLSRPAAVAAVAALPVLAACSASIGGTTFDQDKLTDEITTKLNAEYAQFPRTVSSIDCDDPGDDPAVGTEFGCIADVDGAKVRVDVTTTSEDYDVRFETVDKLFDMAHAAKVLSPSVRQQLGFPVTVDCGTGVKALAPGSTFTCEVANQAGQRDTLTYFVQANNSEDRWEIK